MQILYNLLHIALLPLLILILPFYLISKPEKRNIILKRLGVSLNQPRDSNKPTVWIHALSVGEVTSAFTLVKNLHRAKGSSISITFSTTTGSGYQLAEKLLDSYCDQIIPYPIDFYPLVRFFQEKYNPAVFILIETDFWPNFLHRLARKRVPLLLFNGRISNRSMQRYLRYSFFFRPLFDTFNLLCMQTASDASNMQQLGIAKDKIQVLGNLKFSDDEDGEAKQEDAEPLFPRGKFLLFGGSTHEGEEELLIDAAFDLREKSIPVHLVLAPRHTSRCAEVAGLAADRGIKSAYFSEGPAPVAEMTIIDTIGDLARLYHYADVAFIGGSLVQEGGHNPLEAARFGCPVLFGPNMDDFSEIGEGLVSAGGAVVVKDLKSLSNTLDVFFNDDEARRDCGERAKRYTLAQQNVLDEHLRVIDRYL